jgi:aerobic carbon-monoxide dehydrogenase large subunit
MTITEAPTEGTATTGAPPAAINAIVDALSGLGVDDVPMPASRLNFWNAIHAAQGGSQ